MANAALKLTDYSLSDAERKAVIYLTSGCCDDTGNVGAEQLDRLNMDYQTSADGYFYPLSLEEEMFIAEEFLELDEQRGIMALMGYSALLGDTKYLVPTIEIGYEIPDLQTTLSKQEASEANERAQVIARNIAEVTDGCYYWNADPAIEHDVGEGTFVTEIFIPIEYAKAVAADLVTWQAHLKGIARVRL